MLADTNLLVAVVQSSHAHHKVATAAVARLLTDRHNLFVVPQNVYEFWTVVTRPVTANGFGLSPMAAAVKVRELRQTFDLLPDGPDVLTQWQTLVVRHAVIGKSAHDARLVAAMLVHGVSDLLTLNGPDFARYPNIRVLDPAVVVAGTAP